MQKIVEGVELYFTADDVEIEDKKVAILLSSFGVGTHLFES